jgi:thioredoxin reductase (NADPH)
VEVTGIAADGQLQRVSTTEGELTCRSLVITSGARSNRLGVPGEAELTGRGVSYCATCDGFFYRGRDVAVVGGGNSALEEALFLTRFANRVYLIHRRGRLRADAIVQERVRANEQITLVLDSTVTAIRGEQTVTGIQVCRCNREDQEVIPVSGVFIYIGLVPNTQLFQGQLELNQWGYLATDGAQHTSVPGVYAAGDVQELYLPQVATAVGTGARAAMEAERFIAEQEDRSHPDRLAGMCLLPQEEK